MKPRLLIIGFLLAAQYSLTTNAISPYERRNQRLSTNSIHNSYTPHATTRPHAKSQNRLSPVILLPGDGGSRLEAKLDRKEVLHKYCVRRSDDWFDLWVNLSLLVPFAIDCWVENMKLVYNTTTRKTENAPGVLTRVNGFGLVESVEFVDPSRVYGTGYFDSIVRQLVSYGYERNKNIFGAPYDFRRAPSDLGDFFVDLEKLVLSAYSQNDNEPVVFMCHSMGCLYSQYLLAKKPQAWKDKYIRSLISLSGVYGGSVKAMKAYASGDNFGIVVVPSLSIRKDVRTFSSLPLLLPSPDIFPHNQVLVKSRDKHYTVNDYKSFFQDIDYPMGYEMWKDVKNLTSPYQAPGVEVHCLHGIHVSTPEALNYNYGKFPDSKPEVKNGDGDGTVNLISLRACLNWKDKQTQGVHYKNFTSLDHMTILSNSEVMTYIGEALSKSFKE